MIDTDKLVFANHRRWIRYEIKYEKESKCIRFVAIMIAAVMPESMRATMVAAHIKKHSRRMKRFLKHIIIRKREERQERSFMPTNMVLTYHRRFLFSLTSILGSATVD